MIDSWRMGSSQKRYISSMIHRLFANLRPLSKFCMYEYVCFWTLGSILVLEILYSQMGGQAKSPVFDTPVRQISTWQAVFNRHTQQLPSSKPACQKPINKCCFFFKIRFSFSRLLLYQKVRTRSNSQNPRQQVNWWSRSAAVQPSYYDDQRTRRDDELTSYWFCFKASLFVHRSFYHVRCLLGDHGHGGMQVPWDDFWHDGGVDHSQPSHSVHPGTEIIWATTLLVMQIKWLYIYLGQ